MGQLTAKRPRKHHYIPEFYLRWWTGDDGRLERYSKPIPRKFAVRRVYPSEVGWQYNLYTSPDQQSQTADVLETDFFQWVDNRAAPVLERLNERKSPVLSDDEKSAWVTLIMSIFNRTPENLEAVKSSGQRVWEGIRPTLSEDVNRLSGFDRSGEVDSYLATVRPSHTDQMSLDALPHLIQNTRLVSFINNMHWAVCELPEECFDLLLSDNPIAYTNGLMKNDGHLAMPLSPRRLFVATWKRETLKQMMTLPAKQLVQGMNQWTVESARHFVASPNRLQNRFISNRMGSHLKPGYGRGPL